MRRKWVWIMAVTLLVVLLSSVLPALAQEATVISESTEAAPVDTETTAPTQVSGLGTLVLLMGVGAVLIVGGVALARDAFQPGREVD